MTVFPSVTDREIILTNRYSAPKKTKVKIPISRMALTDAGFLSSPFIVPPFPQKPLQASRYFSDSSVSSTTSPMSQRSARQIRSKTSRLTYSSRFSFAIVEEDTSANSVRADFFIFLSISNFHSRLYWTAIRFISRLVYGRQYSTKIVKSQWIL